MNPGSRLRDLVVRLIQISVTIGLLAWIFRDPRMRHDIWLALRKADPFWLGVGLVVALIGDVSNLVRWGLFLRVQGFMTSWRRIAWLFMTGLYFNLFLFGPTGGDLVRIFYLAVEERTKRTAVVLSVVADRLIGFFVLIPFALFVVIWRYEWLSQTPLARGLLYFLIIFLVISTVVLAAASIAAIPHVIEKLPAQFPARERLVRAAAAYHLFTRHWRVTVVAFLLSFPVLFTFFGTFYCAARAFNADISLVDFFCIMPAITVVTSFPISISGLGVREKIFEELLRDMAGVPGEVGVLISLTGFALFLIWSLVGGVIYAFGDSGVRVPARDIINEGDVP